MSCYYDGLFGEYRKYGLAFGYKIHVITPTAKETFCFEWEFWSCHIGDYVEFCVPGCDAVYYGRNFPKFRGNRLYRQRTRDFIHLLLQLK